MTHQTNCTLAPEFTSKINELGLEGLPELIQVLINHAMQVERENYLGAKPYERSEDRQGHANGYKPKTVKTRVGMRREAAEDIRTIFNPPDRETARVYLNKAAAKQAPMAPKLTDWMEANLPEGFTVFSFPKVHQRRLRTSNGLERLSQEIKR